MSGQTVTILTLMIAACVAAATGQWLLALIGAIVIIGSHCAVFCYIDARNERAAKARRVARFSN
jgi:hypothetical protein